MTIDKIRKLYQTALTQVHSRVFYEEAPDKTTFPYLVYTVSIPDADGEFFEHLYINVEGYDCSADSAVIEALMESVKDALNKKVMIYSDVDENAAIITYFENTMILDKLDPKIKRRNYTFTGRKHGGN